MLARLQSQLRQGIVRIRSRGDHNHINVDVLDHIFRTPVSLNTRMILLRIVVGLGRSLHNRM